MHLGEGSQCPCLPSSGALSLLAELRGECFPPICQLCLSFSSCPGGDASRVRSWEWACGGGWRSRTELSARCLPRGHTLVNGAPFGLQRGEVVKQVLQEQGQTGGVPAEDAGRVQAPSRDGNLGASSQLDPAQHKSGRTPSRPQPENTHCLYLRLLFWGRNHVSGY